MVKDLLFEGRIVQSMVFGNKTFVGKAGTHYFSSSERVGVKADPKTGIVFSVRRYSACKVGPEGVVAYCPGTSRGQFYTSAQARKVAQAFAQHHDPTKK